jgi:hypothetical protein
VQQPHVRRVPQVQGFRVGGEEPPPVRADRATAFGDDAVADFADGLLSFEVPDARLRLGVAEEQDAPVVEQEGRPGRGRIPGPLADQPAVGDIPELHRLRPPEEQADAVPAEGGAGDAAPVGVFLLDAEPVDLAAGDGVPEVDVAVGAHGEHPAVARQEGRGDGAFGVRPGGPQRPCR